MPSRPCRTIAMINQKGGVGKTTTTVNLAAGIAEQGRRVLVVDMDPQAHATLHLGVDQPAQADPAAAAPPTVYDLLVDPTLDPAAAIRTARTFEGEGGGGALDVLPSETDLAAAESELAQEENRLSRLRTALSALQKTDRAYDFVLIDCPPSLGVLTLNALAAAREVFIPMQAHFLALQGVGKLLETVSAVARSVNPRIYVTGVILCMHETSTTHTKEVVADLDGFFQAAREQDVPWKAARVYRPAVRRNIKLAECPSFGQTIFDYAPACPGAQDYKALAESLVSEWDRLRARKAEAAAEAAAEVTVRPAVPTEAPA
jgi:chromosome partitioning protein